MKYFFTAVLLLLTANVFAQDTIYSSVRSDSVFTLVEIMPEFPGGEQALFKFLAENINYPKKARERGIKGKIYVRFTVDKEGYIQDVEIVKGVSAELDAEAIRVVTIMPRWKPGTQNGKPVSVVMNLPIVFALKELK